MSALIPTAVCIFQPERQQLQTLFDLLIRSARPLFVYVNGEVSAEIEEMLRGLPNADIVRSAVNRGLGYALNQLANQAFAAGHTHLFLVDQDSEPPVGLPEALREHWAELEVKLGQLAAVGPRLAPAEAGFRPIRYYWIDEARGIAAFLPTSGSLISAAAFADVGPFRADYFIDGIDVEWGLRAMRKGRACAVVESLVMPHRWGIPVVSGTANIPQIMRQPPLRVYYHIRNTIDLLRSTRPPLRISAVLGGILFAQIVLLLARRSFDPAIRRAMLASLRDGFVRRFGSASLPED